LRRIQLKIGYRGLDLPEGKIKYNDQILDALSNKDKPKKVSPFYVDFLPGEFDKCDVIVIAKSSILDLLIHDMEKIETRMMRVTDAEETAILQSCLDNLEAEVPLSDLHLTRHEFGVVALAAPFSLKPVIQIDGIADIDDIITTALDRSGLMFFYTSGPSESHAWLVERYSDIVSCAATIHTDLARGFIKGDVVSFEEYMSCHSFNDARAKGVARLTNRDYIVQPGEIIEIRFNVAP
jgi:ribosome-binding ATPase YchF (GTP1/OBG family)